nr:unnamed protein product [Spirometra erinaceieuropaei]
MLNFYMISLLFVPQLPIVFSASQARMRPLLSLPPSTRTAAMNEHRLRSRLTSLSRPSPASIFADNPRSNRPERRTALVERELARYKVDIAALSETRFSEQGQLEEVEEVAVGSPLGPLEADVFIGKLEKNQLCRLIKDFNSYARYVDAVFNGG